MKKEYAIFAVALVFFLVLTQFVIFDVDRELWFDASFSLQTANNINDGMLSIGDFKSYDVHPPSFYYMLAGWQTINPANISKYHWAQELSVLAGLLFLIFAFIGLKEFFGMKGVYALLPLVFGTTYLHFATEIRMYMFVIACSAILFAALAKKFKGVWLYAAVGASFILPNLHYLAAMALPFFLFMHLIINKREEDKWLVFWLLLLSWVAAILVALNFALPQRFRTEGTWFQPPTLSSWGSALFYSIWIGDVFSVQLGQFGVVVFTAFKYAVVGLAGAAVGYVVMKKHNIGARLKVLLLMGFTGLIPIAALAFLIAGKTLTNGGAFWNLYHHRFFLVLTWMFAVALFIQLQYVFEWLNGRWKYASKVGIIIVVCVMVLMVQGYAVGAQHELERTIKETPCYYTEMRANGVEYPAVLWIGHESPFSAIPYKLYGEEQGCKWNHFISTRMTVKMSHSAGFDAIPNMDVYWNGTIPRHMFYYVMSEEKGINTSDRITSLMYEDDGISLVRVNEQLLVTVNFS